MNPTPRTQRQVKPSVPGTGKESVKCQVSSAKKFFLALRSWPLALKNGYILVITVLFIGAILVATTVSLLALGWAAEQNGVVYSNTNQALEAAQGCMGIALDKMRKNGSYAGFETYVFPGNLGSCEILSIQGGGYSNRTICTEGTSGDTTRRLRMKVSAFLPLVVISEAEEIPAVGTCGGIESFNSSSSPGGGASSSNASSVAVGSSSAASSIGASSSTAASSAASSVNPNCGNASCQLSEGEECDDGNTDNGDGCSSACLVEVGCTCMGSCSEGSPRLCSCIVYESSSSADSSDASSAASCGNFTCEGGAGEQCDLGAVNMGIGTGCLNNCQIEFGWSCAPACGGGPQSCSAASSSSGGGGMPGVGM